MNKTKHCRKGHAYKGYRCPVCHPRRNGRSASRARSPRTFRADSVLSSLGSVPQAMAVMHYCRYCYKWYRDDEQHDCSDAIVEALNLAASEVGATAEWLTPRDVAQLDSINFSEEHQYMVCACGYTATGLIDGLAHHSECVTAQLRPEQIAHLEMLCTDYEPEPPAYDGMWK